MTDVKDKKDKKQAEKSEPRSIQRSDMVITGDLKQAAFLLLSDAGMLKDKRLNLSRFAAFAKLEIDRTPTNVGYVGYVNHYKAGFRVGVSQDLNELEARWETAILISTYLMFNLSSLVPQGYSLNHSSSDKSFVFEEPKKLAKYLMLFSFSSRELDILLSPNSDKKLSKLARKRGVPTKLLLERLQEEI